MNLDSMLLLLVEDNPGDARLIKESLCAMARAQLLTVIRLDAAIAALSEQTFDVILLDLSLPDSQGMATVHSILKVAPQIPLVVLTGYHNEELALQAVRAGAQDFLVKDDVTERVLIHTIGYAIERKQIELREQSRSRILELLSSGAPLTEILLTIVKSVEQERPALLCSILLLDNQTKRLIVGASHSLPEFYNTAINGVEIGPHRGSCGTSAYTGKLVIVEDVQTHPYWTDYKELASQADFRACWSMPIKSVSEKILGTFAIYHREPARPTDADIQLITEAANLARIAIERSRANEELQLAALVYQNSSQGMAVTDDMGNIITINPAFTEITGYSLDEVFGKNPRILSSGRQDDLFYDRLWRNLLNTGTWQGELWNRRKNGEIYAEWLTINTIFNEKGSVHRRVALFSDITKIKESEELIWQQANFDPLTELPNRRMFHDRLKQEIKQSRRSGKRLALMFIDLDHFKEVNDTLGHSMGDLLLKEAALRLGKCIRETDTVARLGGDEFTIILSGFDDSKVINRIAESILIKLVEPFQLGVETAYISASIGITLYPDDANNIEDLLKNADQAMYAAKAQGRNRCNYFTASMQAAAQKKMRFINDLRGALAGKQFQLFYQPVVELTTGRIYKAEALLRWLHPRNGYIDPAEFIPIAEDTSMIIEIGEWVFQEAVHQVKQWRSTLNADFQISINKSPIQFQSKHNNHVLWFQYLSSLGLSTSSIAIEITERLLLDASHFITDQLLTLRDEGIQVSLDDFGTGYSSLSYLKKFDIDYLKIDRSFVSNLELGSNDLVLCEAIIVMAHKLGIEVIAEGIETEIQRDLLIAAGCDYGQGYLFSKPLPAPEFEAFIVNGLTIK